MKKNKVQLLVLFCVIFIQYTAYTTTVEPYFFDSQKAISFANKTVYLKDKNQSFTINQVIDKYRNDEFTSCSKKVFTNFASTNSFWFSFSLNSVNKNTLWLNIGSSNVDSIHFYKFNDEFDLVEKMVIGSLFDKELNPSNAKTFWIPIINKDDLNTYQFFIKTYSSTTLELPFEVGTYEMLLKKRRINEFLSVFFLGAVLLVFIYNTLISIIINDKLSLLYLFFILVISLNISFYNNYPIIENILGIEIAYKYSIIWITPGVMLFGVYAIKYFDLQLNFPKLYWVFNITITLFAIIGILNISLPLVYLTNIFQGLTSFLVLLSSITAWLSWRKKIKHSGFKAVGWTIVSLSFILFFSVINGFVPYTILTRNIVYFAALIEIILFTIVQVRKINELKTSEEILNFELKLKNEELSLNNKVLDDFNYNVSHSLKTILSNGNSMARMAKKYHDKNDKVKLEEVINRLLNVTSNGLETVKNFLTIDTFENMLELNPKNKRNFKQEIERIIINNDLQNLIDVEIEISGIEDVYIHNKVLDIIFLNFLSNSIKKSDDKPIIKIKLVQDNNELVIVYSDNNYDKHIYNSVNLSQLEINSQDNDLGYYFLKQIINKNNGAITVDSNPENGTKIEIKFRV